FMRVLYYPWSGRREDANSKAAMIDAKIFGPQALILSVYWCMCGAPWDLEVTPNFAQKIEEAGFDWPPPSPIKWPLKDW
ncbi:MAG: adenylate cyclase, partial [Bacteroidia bacterium]